MDELLRSIPAINQNLDTSPSLHPESRPQKRSRTTFSCSSCRTSKIKCDKADKGIDDPCTPCSMRGRPCLPQGESAPVVSQPAPPPSHPKRTSASVAPVNPVLYYSQPGPSLSHASSLNRDDRRAYHLCPTISLIFVRIMDALAEIKDILLTQNRHASPSEDVAEPASSTQATIGNEGLPNYPDQKALLTGQYRMDGEVIRDDVSCLMSLGAALAMLPSKAVLDNLLFAFFNDAQALDHFVEEKPFRARWETLQMLRAASADPLCTYHDAITLSTIFLAMACCILYLSHRSPAILGLAKELGDNFSAPQQIDVYMATSRWIVAKANWERSQSAINSSDGSLAVLPPASLEQMEMMSLEVMALCFTKVNTDAIWKRVFVLIGMALELRLHRKDGHPPEHIEARRHRLWYNVFGVEKYVSQMSQRPSVLAINCFDIPLPHVSADMSADDRFLALKARFSIIFASWTAHGNSALSIPATRKSLRSLDAWWAQCGEMGFAATQMELTSALLNTTDFEQHITGRRQMYLACNFSHMSLMLTRPFGISDEEQDVNCSIERARCYRCASDILQQFTMIISIWQMLSTDQRDLLPLNTILAWLPFMAFDSVLLLIWQVFGKPPGSERDSLISLVVQCRNTYAYICDNQVSVAPRALAVIDALLPLISSASQDPGARRQNRRRLNELFHGVLTKNTFAEPNGTAPLRSDSSSSNFSPNATLASTPSSMSSSQDLGLDLSWPAYDANMFMLGNNWSEFIQQAAL